MKPISILSALLLAVLPLCAQTTPTLDQLLSNELQPKEVKTITFHPDGTGYLRLEKGGKEIAKYSFNGKVREVLFSLENDRVKEMSAQKPIEKIDRFDFSNDGNKLLFSTNTEKVGLNGTLAHYYIYDLRRNYLSAVDDTLKQQAAYLSPNGRMVAYVKKNDLYLIRIDFNYAETRITKDGAQDKLLNGVADETARQFFGLDQAIQWSPDNGHIAFYRTDLSAVGTTHFDRYLNSTPLGRLYPEAVSYAYPKAGGSNPKVQIMTYNIATKITKEMLPDRKEAEYLPRMEFVPSTGQLAIFTLNRYQNRLELYFCSPRAGVGSLVFSESTDTYISPETYKQALFTPQGFYLLSDRTGYNQIYRYQLSGTPAGTLTESKTDITRLIAVDTVSYDLLYQAANASALRRDIYTYSAKKKKSTKLNLEEGWNETYPSPRFDYLLMVHSSAGRLPSSELITPDWKNRFPIEENRELGKKLKEYTIQPKEFFTFKNSTGTSLNGWSTKPQGFNPSNRYPVLLVQYNGPASYNVVDRWSLGYEQYFAAKGYLVVCVDTRGTAGRGRDFRKQTYKRLGILESDDLADCARYLSTLPYVNREKINLYGWSHGGFNTLMTLSRSKGLFRSGIAIAPITDFRLLAPLYSERFLSTPSQNLEGYQQSSPIVLAPNLSGNLLLVHGTADNMVELQNTLNYTHALDQAGKLYEMQLYTDQDHFIPVTYPQNVRLYRRIEAFLSK